MVLNDGINLAGTIAILRHAAAAARILRIESAFSQRCGDVAEKLAKSSQWLYNGRYLQASEDNDAVNMSSIAPICSPSAPSSSDRPHWPAAMALFLVSASGLIFEIALTRVFSLLFQYHYVFLAISLATLGLSLGAVLARFLCFSRPAAAGERLPRLTLLALSVTFPLVGVFLARFSFVGSILPQAAAALIPFLLVGLYAALTFASSPGRSGVLYGADLLGAAAGVTASVGLLNLLGAFSVVMGLGMIAA
ncbi:MAG: hypothetical protein PVG71_11965, partial [Anaerolineae bacterium]